MPSFTATNSIDVVGSQVVTGGLTIGAIAQGTEVAAGLKITTGGATIDAGGLVVTLGGATVSAGGLTVSAGAATVPYLSLTGINSDVNAGARFVGGIASGAPLGGSYLVGDVVVDRTGKIWICTTAGSPGTWTQVSGSGGGGSSGTTTYPLTIGSGLSGTTSTFNGSAANTISLNVGNANTWTAAQTFSNATYSALFTGGNVGIGTTSPGSPLDIQGATGFFVNLRRANGATGEAPDIRYQKSRGSIATPAVTVSGDYLGHITFDGYDGASFVRGAGIYATINGTVATNSVPTDLQFLTLSGTTLAERMRITSAGLVGIGTTSPGNTLHLHSSVSGGANYLQVTNGTTGSASTDGLFVGIDGTNAIVWFSEANALRFATSDAERMRITSAGLVGIGTTGPQAFAKLQVSAADNAVLMVEDAGTGSGYLSQLATITNLAAEAQLTFSTGVSYSTGPAVSGTERMRISSAGNVGIGTTAPSFKLHVSGDISPLALSSVTANTQSSILLLDAGTAKWIFGKENDQSIFMWDTSTAFRVNYLGNMYLRGNVGIGTTSPESLLSVRKDVAGGRGGEISIVNGAGATVGSDVALNFAVEGSSYSLNDNNAQIRAVLVNAGNGATDFVHSLWSGGGFIERMRITSAGNVGIGHTAPDALLGFKNTSAFADKLVFFPLITQSLFLRPTGTNGQLQMWSDQTSANVMTWTTAGLVGIGTTTPNSTLHASGSFSVAVLSITGATTLDATHSVVFCGGTTSYQVTLPTAVGITGRMYQIKKNSTSAYTLTLGTTSSQTIDGVTSLVLTTQYNNIVVISNGANWSIL